MMMETVVYSREYLFVKELYDKGELGRIQFLRGSHQQDMDGWPGYWPGLPPMWYATHCVSPCLALARQARRERRLPRLRAHRRGADPEVQQPVRDRDGDVQDEGPRRGRRGDAQPVRHGPAVPRELRRDGAKKSFEWQQVEDEEPVIHTARGEAARAGDPGADEGAGLRAAAAGADPQVHAAGRDPGRRPPVVPPGRRPRRSHPHLAHNFLMACLGKQPAFPDAATTANWTLVGICAHESALEDGRRSRFRGSSQLLKNCCKRRRCSWSPAAEAGPAVGDVKVVRAR